MSGDIPAVQVQSKASSLAAGALDPAMPSHPMPRHSRARQGGSLHAHRALHFKVRSISC
jgi:hypothetical protein